MPQSTDRINRVLALRASRSEKAIVIGNRAGVLEWANEAWTRVTGVPLHDSIAKPVGALLADVGVDVEVVDFVQARFLRGERCEVELDLSLITGEDRFIHIEVEPFCDRFGEVSEFIAVATDITARRRAERAQRPDPVAATPASIERGNADVRPSSRGDAEIRAAVALAVPLAADVCSLADAVEGEAFDDDSRSREIRARAADARALGSELLALSRGASDPGGEATTLEVGCLSALARLREDDELVAIDLSVAGNLPAVRANPAVARAIVCELLRGARRAIGDEWGTLTVSAQRVDVGGWIRSCAYPGPALSDRFGDGGAVSFEVHDTGPALSAAELARLRSPGPMADAGRRVVGLRAARAAAEATGGELRVDSEPGIGTRAALLLPVAAGPQR